MVLHSRKDQWSVGAALVGLDLAAAGCAWARRIVDAVLSFLTRLQREPWLRFDPELAV